MVNGQRRRQMVALAALSLMLLLAPIALPWFAGPIGQSDFIGYWSASRLLLEGRDPYDVEALRTLRRSQYPERGPVIYTSIAAVTLLYPDWLNSYLGSVSERGLTLWQTPTLGGALFTVWPMS